MGSEVKTEANKPQEEVIVDKYFLLLGFETNFAETAFIEKEVGIFIKKKEYVQILEGEGRDYGHAFFYVTKNDVVESFFSFGPREELGEIKYKGGEVAGNEKPYANGYVNKRPSDSHYEITEVTRIFKLALTEKKFQKIVKKVEELEKKIAEGKPYHVLMNDTCAEEAEDILDDIIDDFPDGKGYVDIGIMIPPFKVVNPYMWCYQCFLKYGKPYKYPEYPELGKAKNILDPDGEFECSVIAWNLKKGDSDPLHDHGYYDQ